MTTLPLGERINSKDLPGYQELSKKGRFKDLHKGPPSVLHTNRTETNVAHRSETEIARPNVERTRHLDEIEYQRQDLTPVSGNLVTT